MTQKDSNYMAPADADQHVPGTPRGEEQEGRHKEAGRIDTEPEDGPNGPVGISTPRDKSGINPCATT